MPIGLLGLVGAVVIFALSIWGVSEGLPDSCDEPYDPGSRIQRGCNFLADGGYTAIKIVPGLVFAAFALYASQVKRVGILILGFSLALVLVVVSMAYEPANYPWL